MAKEKPIIVTGTVTESLPNVMFRVILDTNGITILCQASGKLRQNFIKIGGYYNRKNIFFKEVLIWLGIFQK